MGRRTTIPLYLIDIANFKKIIIDFETNVVSKVIIKNTKATATFLPKPSIAVLGNHVISTNYANDNLSYYKLEKSTIDKMPKLDGYLLNILSQIIFPETIEAVEILKLWQTNDSSIVLLTGPLYDSLGLNAFNYMLNFTLDKTNEFGLKYISYEKLPYNFAKVDTININANYRANYYKQNNDLIGQLYCPPGDINRNNQIDLETKHGFNLPIFFKLDTKTKQLKYYSNRIPDNAVKHGSYYFNLEYNILKLNDSVYLASERYLNYISVINDTIKYRFSNVENNSDCYNIGANRQLRVLNFSIINKMLCVLVKELVDYRLKIYSTTTNRIIYDQKLDIINPSFSSYDNKIVIVEAKGMKLKSISISELSINTIEP